jgi:hypothetical protein
MREFSTSVDRRLLSDIDVLKVNHLEDIANGAIRDRRPDQLYVVASFFVDLARSYPGSRTHEEAIRVAAIRDAEALCRRGPHLEGALMSALNVPPGFAHDVASELARFNEVRISTLAQIMRASLDTGEMPI